MSICADVNVSYDAYITDCQLNFANEELFFEISNNKRINNKDEICQKKKNFFLKDGGTIIWNVLLKNKKKENSV